MHLRIEECKQPVMTLNAERPPKVSSSTAFQSLIHYSSQLIWLLNAEGQVLEANRTALTFGQVDLAQVVNQSVYIGWQFSPREQVRLQAAIASAAQGHIIRYDAAIQTKSHHSTTFNIVLRKIDHVGEDLIDHEAAGSMLLMMEGTDVSDRKQIETMLRRGQRVQSVGQMTVGLAHDLSNLLTPLSGISHLLHIEFPEANKEQGELFQLLGTTAHRAKSLVKQMLTFIRGHSDIYEIIESDRLVQEISTLLRTIFPNSISIETYLPPGLWTIEGNENQLHQVLVNLCLNARDAMPNGGFLKLSAENIQIDQTEAVEKTETASRNYVAIQVADTGEGIPAYLLDNVFTPFFTTRKAREGTGIGLSIAADIINSHGGFIDVLTDNTHVSRTGTQFWVYLPATV